MQPRQFCSKHQHPLSILEAWGVELKHREPTFVLSSLLGSWSPWFTEWHASLKCRTPFPLGPQRLIFILCFVEQKTAFQWPWSSVPSQLLPSIHEQDPCCPQLWKFWPSLCLWNSRLLDTHRWMMDSEVIVICVPWQHPAMGNIVTENHLWFPLTAVVKVCI